MSIKQSFRSALYEMTNEVGLTRFHLHLSAAKLNDLLTYVQH
jgi:hypothetical protein